MNLETNDTSIESSYIGRLESAIGIILRVATPP